jgi:phage tail protein X
MRLITVESRETLESLADRAYADLTPESRRVAVEALRKANPQLRIGEALKPGMVVQVPDVAGLRPRPDTNAQDPVREVLALLSDEISGYSKHLAGRLATVSNDIKQQTDLLNDSEVGRVLSSTRGAADLAKALGESLNRRSRLIAEAERAQGAAFTQIARDIRSLASLIEASEPPP